MLYMCVWSLQGQGKSTLVFNFVKKKKMQYSVFNVPVGLLDAYFR